jgi:DNA-binding FadR family transcriptional regulator
MTMPLSSPVRAETLSIQVARQIENLITSGVWAVGTRIPPEKDLVSRLMVSRNTIREALRSLVHTGMLEARAGDGTYVRAPSELAVPLLRRVKRGNLAEAVEVRAGLERQAARLAAERRTAAEVSRMRELLRELRTAAVNHDRAAYTTVDAELHRTILGCSRNELLAEIYDHLGGALKPSFMPDLWDNALAADEVEYHIALVDAIEAADPAAAEAAADNIIGLLTRTLLPPDNRTQ